LPTHWQVRVQDQPDCEADALCLALPAPQAGRLLASVEPALAEALQIPYASSAVVNVAYRRSDITHALNGMGFVVPAVEKRGLIACSFSSVKFAGRAPASHVLLRAFVGGALQQTQYNLADEEIQRRVCQELQQLLGIGGQPLFVDLSRHAQSMPQYQVGHRQRLTDIESRVQRFPGLTLAGNAYHGVGIPDCIASGEQAAQTLLSFLTASASPTATLTAPIESG
jgi:oxygen-dependent protoporphyrinogen oxidase